MYFKNQRGECTGQLPTYFRFLFQSNPFHIFLYNPNYPTYLFYLLKLNNIHHIVYNAQKNIIFICLSSEDNSLNVEHLYSYHGDDMTFAGKYQIQSPGLSTAISQNGERVFVAPTDADEVGVFVVEFSQNTKLEKNYYLSAGNLASRGIALDSDEENLYLLVNSICHLNILFP